MKTLPYLALLLTVLMAIATASGWGVLELQSADFLSLFTCHGVHTSWSQWFFTGSVVVLFMALCELGEKRTQAAFVLFLSAFVVSSSVLLFKADTLAAYQGSSGISHALFMYWAVAVASKKSGSFCAILLTLKVFLELLTGRVSCELGLQGAQPVPLAHAMGLAVGFSVALCSRVIRTRRARIDEGDPAIMSLVRTSLVLILLTTIFDD